MILFPPGISGRSEVIAAVIAISVTAVVWFLVRLVRRWRA